MSRRERSDRGRRGDAPRREEEARVYVPRTLRAQERDNTDNFDNREESSPSREAREYRDDDFSRRAPKRAPRGADKRKGKWRDEEPARAYRPRTLRRSDAQEQEENQYQSDSISYDKLYRERSEDGGWRSEKAKDEKPWRKGRSAEQRREGKGRGDRYHDRAQGERADRYSRDDSRSERYKSQGYRKERYSRDDRRTDRYDDRAHEERYSRDDRRASRYGSRDRDYRKERYSADEERFTPRNRAVREERSRYGARGNRYGRQDTRARNRDSYQEKIERIGGEAPNLPAPFDPNAPMRLNRYIAHSGLCSRREADELIAKGEILVNGEVVSELGTKVIPSQVEITHQGKRIDPEKKVYILLNKPKNCFTTTDDPHAGRTVIDAIKGASTERVYPVGRLDRNSTGLLLLTNDGALTEKLTHPSYEKRKVYEVTVDRDVTDQEMEHLLSGVELEDGLMAADAVEFPVEGRRDVVGIEIHSGQNRVIRRMFDALGFRVKALDRVYYAGLTKKNLPRGKWRFLTEAEITTIKTGKYA